MGWWKKSFSSSLPLSFSICRTTSEPHCSGRSEDELTLAVPHLKGSKSCFSNWLASSPETLITGVMRLFQSLQGLKGTSKGEYSTAWSSIHFSNSLYSWEVNHVQISFENKGIVHCEEVSSEHLNIQTTNFGFIISVKPQNNLCIIRQWENQPCLCLLSIPSALGTSCWIEAIQLFFCFHVLNSLPAVVKEGSE